MPSMQGVDHYENFPVASWLCPPALRPPISAIYHFARTADDLADEGEVPASQRLADLAAYRADLTAVFQRTPPSARWAPVFAVLRRAIDSHHLPSRPLYDLLDAFEQDVHYTAQKIRYPNAASLLEYCRLSANPVGRLLLHLYGVNDAESLQQSDAICSALQLINFWQDLSIDLSRQRHYLPLDALAHHGIDEANLPNAPHGSEQDRAAQAMLQELVQHARTLMLRGAPLATRLPGRIGWELRLVVQGGMRITDKLQTMHWRSWQRRPKLGATDLPILLWRAGQMSNLR